MAPAKSASPILGWRELPRASRARRRALERRPTWLRSNWRASKSPPGATSTRWVWSSTKSSPASAPSKIGRASCRERGEISGGAGSFKKKKEDLSGGEADVLKNKMLWPLARRDHDARQACSHPIL